MRITTKDMVLSRRFPEKETAGGFGASMADAGISTMDMHRLIDRGLVKITSRGLGFAVGGKEKIHRVHTHFIRTFS